MQYSTKIRPKDGGYQYIITYKDNQGIWKQKSKQGFSKRADAQTAMDDRLYELKNILKNNISISNNIITFKSFSSEFIKHHSLYVNFRTIVYYETAIKKFELLNDKELSKITKLDIQSCVDLMTKEGMYEDSIKSYLSKVKKIFKYAIEDYKLLTENPTINIKIKKQIRDEEIKALNDDEIRRVLDIFEFTKYRLFINIAFFTGMRLGEILGLKWCDIDFKNKTLNFNKQWGKLETGEYGFKECKNKNAYRTIPLPKNLELELDRIKVRHLDGRILHQFNTNENLSEMISTVSTRRGFTITPHMLRHTYATKLIANGIDFKTAAKLLGHTVEMTMKKYSHVTDDMMNRAVNIIHNVF